MVVLKSGVALNLFGSVTVDMGYDCCSVKQFLNMHFFSRYNRKKMSLQQRKARVAQKKAYFLKQQGDGEDEEEDDERACQLK